MKKQTRSNLLCLITAIVWGGGFIAQKTGSVLGANNYNGPRNLIGGLALLPVILIMHLQDDHRKTLITGGLVCGLLLFIASTLQQIGVTYTSAGKAGFITSLYAIIVPLLSALSGKKIPRIVWLSVLLSLLGLYLLNSNGQIFYFDKGDLFVLASSFMFALQIMAIDHYAPQTQPVILSAIQFLVAGVLGCVCMFLFESPKLPQMMAFWPTYLYGGVLSTGLGYTLQIIAQKDGNATQCSLILCLESVFSALGGALLLNERLTILQISGCTFIFLAVMITTWKGA